MAGMTNPAKEINVAECHDCFTITEIMNYEDLGFFEPGRGGARSSEGARGSAARCRSTPRAGSSRAATPSAPPASG